MTAVHFRAAAIFGGPPLAHGWPARSAKVVLQLALDRLVRHYGYGGEAHGRGHAPIRTWLADDAGFAVDDD